MYGRNVWSNDAPAYGNVQLAIDASTGFVPAPVETDLNLDTANVVSWNAQEGHNYQTQYSTNGGAAWIDLVPTFQADATGTKEIADPGGIVGGRIYQVLRTPTATPPPN